MFFSVSSTSFLFIFSPLNKSYKLIFKISVSGIKTDISGKHNPRSHLLTALSDTYNLSAKSFCVIFNFFLASKIIIPVFFGSIFFPPYTYNFILKKMNSKPTCGLVIYFNHRFRN